MLDHAHQLIGRFGMFVGVGLIALANGLERFALGGVRVLGAVPPDVSTLNKVAAVVGIVTSVVTCTLKVIDFLAARRKDHSR